jgi:hypothetical protein
LKDEKKKLVEFFVLFCFVIFKFFWCRVTRQTQTNDGLVLGTSGWRRRSTAWPLWWTKSAKMKK